MKLLPGSLVLLRKISVYYVLSEMPRFSSKCLCCACSLIPVAICCGSYTFPLKVSSVGVLSEKHSLGVQSPRPARAELDGSAPSPLLILLAPLVKSAPSAVGSASCLLHLPLCAFCQPLGLLWPAPGVASDPPCHPAATQFHPVEKNLPPAALAHFCFCCAPVCTFLLCSRCGSVSCSHCQPAACLCK